MQKPENMSSSTICINYSPFIDGRTGDKTFQISQGHIDYDSVLPQDTITELGHEVPVPDNY